jgi:hypothetical protein
MDAVEAEYTRHIAGALRQGDQEKAIDLHQGLMEYQKYFKVDET